MLSFLRRRPPAGKKSDHRYEGSPPCPPEAFQYDDDVTPEGIAQLRAAAAETMSKGHWTIIDGYVRDPDKRKMG
jgi:hypothetical protein